MDIKVTGMVTRSGRRLSVDKQESRDEDNNSTCSTPTKRRVRRLSTKPDLEDLPEAEMPLNSQSPVLTTSQPSEPTASDSIRKELPLHTISNNILDSPSRNLRKRNLSLTSPMESKPRENVTPRKAMKKVESSLMHNIVDSPKLRKNKRLSGGLDLDISQDLTGLRRSRRLSGELNVLLEDPIREEQQESAKANISRRGKRLSIMPSHPPLPEECEDIKEIEPLSQDTSEDKYMDKSLNLSTLPVVIDNLHTKSPSKEGEQSVLSPHQSTKLDNLQEVNISSSDTNEQITSSNPCNVLDPDFTEGDSFRTSINSQKEDELISPQKDELDMKNSQDRDNIQDGDVRIEPTKSPHVAKSPYMNVKVKRSDGNIVDKLTLHKAFSQTESTPSNNKSHVSEIDDSPSTETKRLSTTISSPSTETKRLSTTISSPSTETKRLSTTISSPSTETKRLSTTISSPSTETKRLSTTISSPSTETKRLSTTISSPSTETKRLSTTSTEPKRLSTAILSPSSESKRLPTTISSPSTETKRLSTTSTEPKRLSTRILSPESMRLSTTSSSPSTESKRLSTTNLSPSTDSKTLSTTSLSPSTESEGFSATSLSPSTEAKRLSTLCLDESIDVIPSSQEVDAVGGSNNSVESVQFSPVQEAKITSRKVNIEESTKSQDIKLCDDNSSIVSATDSNRKCKIIDSLTPQGVSATNNSFTNKSFNLSNNEVIGIGKEIINNSVTEDISMHSVSQSKMKLSESTNINESPSNGNKKQVNSSMTSTPSSNQKSPSLLRDAVCSQSENCEDFIRLQLIDESASEAGSEYKSGDSLCGSEREEIELNEIVERGESLYSESGEEESDVSSYEKDSFVCSSEDDNSVPTNDETKQAELVSHNKSLVISQSDSNEIVENIADTKSNKVEGMWIVSPLKLTAQPLQSNLRKRKLVDGNETDSSWTGTAGDFSITEKIVLETPTCPMSASDFGSTTTFNIVTLRKPPKNILTADPLTTSAVSFKQTMLYGSNIRRKETKNIQHKMKASNLYKNK